MSKTKRSHGFTLTEILIALAIIAILVAIAVPVIGGLMNKGTDTSEDVNAALYTSIMNKFAVEEVESAASYPRLTTTGSNPEYATFADKAGNGNFPGYNIIAGLGGADVLDQIRREAVIAIKAFSDTAVNDEYYITPPADSDYEYVYYYLTGEVKKEKRSDMTTTPSADLLTGNINIKDYWVYLSRDGGSGAALGGVANGTGYLFVQVLQYGTGQPLDGATVRVTSGATTYTAVTQPGQNGYVGFSGIPLGSVNVSIERHGAISFPDSRYYSKSGEVFISEGGYEGCQLNLPYVVDLKLGSLGSLGFYEEKVVWTEGRWDVVRDKILDSVTVTSAFSPNTGNPGGVPRAETYTSNLYATAGVQQLLTGDKYLTYGNYNMTITSYGYRTYREAVTAKVFGIDNASGAYSGFTSAYEYPIIMKYPAGQSVVSGTIERESAEQPSQGTISGLSGTWAYTDNYYVYARVKLTNTSTGETYYSSYFSYDEEGKHDYTVSGLPDGTYLFEVESPYQHYDLSEFPETVTIDGRHVEVSGKLHREDAGEGEISGFVTYDFEGNYDPIAGVTVSFTRYGDDTSAASATTDEEGYYSVTGLTNGFYQMRVTLPYGLGGTTTYYKMFISGAEECDVELSLPTFTVYGYIEPYRDGSYLNVYNVLFDVEVTFYRIDMTGAKIYSSMTAYIEQEDVDAYYSIELVPGYYYVEITSVCFNDHRSSKLNFRDDANKNFELNLDLYDEDNHFEFYENCDDNGHWDECANCLEAFNFEEHTPSGWTYYSTSYCYRYCTVCGYNTTGLTSHNMSSYVSKAATCTETGTRVYYCTRGCGYTYTAVISKGGHTGNGVWVYDNNGSSSSAGTHHQNCKVCGTTMNAGTACSRASTKYSNGETNHYDSCSTCSGRRYFDHNWTEVSRTGYVCTGGTINYKCTDCGATKTGSYEATSAHNGRARCNVRHSCSWDTYCSAKGQHVWNGYYHILCSNCGAIQDHKWCAMHSDVSTVLQCPN